MRYLESDSIKWPKLLFTLLVIVGVTACASTGAVANKPVKKPTTNDEKALIHTKLARGYMQQQQYATAKTQLDKALSISPKHSDSHYVMALLMIELEQYPEADEHFSKAVRYDPQNSSAAHDFGTFLCQLGQADRAVENFEIAASNPLFKQAVLSYARAGQCLAGKDNQRAELFLRKAISLDPRMRPALFSLAQIKYLQKQYLPARAYIERYLAITDPQPSSLMLAYKIESSLKSEEQAKRYRSQILLSFPGSKQANELRAEKRS